MSNNPSYWANLSTPSDWSNRFADSDWPNMSADSAPSSPTLSAVSTTTEWSAAPDPALSLSDGEDFMLEWLRFLWKMSPRPDAFPETATSLPARPSTPSLRPLTRRSHHPPPFGPIETRQNRPLPLIAALRGLPPTLRQNRPADTTLGVRGPPSQPPRQNRPASTILEVRGPPPPPPPQNRPATTTLAFRGPPPPPLSNNVDVLRGPMLVPLPPGGDAERQCLCLMCTEEDI